MCEQFKLWGDGTNVYACLSFRWLSIDQTIFFCWLICMFQLMLYFQSKTFQSSGDKVALVFKSSTLYLATAPRLTCMTKYLLHFLPFNMKFMRNLPELVSLIPYEMIMPTSFVRSWVQINVLSVISQLLSYPSL